MSIRKPQKFIHFLDYYEQNLKYNSFDYSILTSVINSHYVNNSLCDENFIGKKRSASSSTPPNNNACDLSNNYYYLYAPSIWNDTNIFQDPYQSWQKQHEISTQTLLPKMTEPSVKKEFINIDAEVNSLTDVLKMIDEYKCSPEIEYNIDIKSLHNIKDELITLNSMIGMDSMKQSILNQLVYFVQNLHIGKNISDFKHTAIYGPPGTGKTEIAKIIGKMYSKLGILTKNVFKKVTRNDLIAGYLGQTAIKTKKVIEDCLGGVLFIDEAYSLANGDREDSYSKECLDTICESLSDHKNDLMVIIAGYENELNETFFRVNRGLESRFIWRFTMDEYNSKELMNIFNKMVIDQEWKMADELIPTEKWMEERKKNFKHFGRDMELLLTYTKIAHGRRIYGKPVELRKKITLEDLNQGYNVFLKNKNIKKEPVFMHGIYV
jgi:SpoVK/Ycf46/Vps4 family AAA+-type ATPase